VPARDRLLILGGTAEAVALAGAASALPGLEVVSSLAGRTRAAPTPPGRSRVGGFGGAEGLRAYLRDERIDLLVDATHPFAARISEAARLACETAGVPRLVLWRPPWPRQPGDRWHEVADLAEAAARLPELGRRVFLTVGARDVAPFAPLAGTWFLVRAVEAPGPLPLARCAVIIGRGPFARDDERALLRRHGIDVVVSKASGGDATYGKIAAARDLGVPVLMVRRPPPPAGECVATVAEAAAWLERHRSSCASGAEGSGQVEQARPDNRSF
jgi:precorrin-6A/cobalt-precorrin-6A reductase